MAKNNDIGPMLELLKLLAGADEFRVAVDLAKDRLKLTPEKISLILIRLINPDEVLGEMEEAKVRGVSAPTLRGMKEREELPRVVNG